jgi:2,4-dienoyl-CoA reductase-like NADH-dependent reductase (Old Yellow Enzyme family)
MTPLLFEPLRIGPLRLPNRIVSLPMYLAYPDPDHEVNDLVLDYYDEMAGSGVGLVVVENVTVEPCGLGNPRTLMISEDRFVPGLARLARAIRAHGVPAVLQLHHAGRYAKRPDRIAPSPIETWGVVPREMGPAEIDRVTAAFAAGARRALEAGFDAVELHGGTGYLFTQFLSPRTNRRSDAYGGDAGGRARFPLEVVRAVRDAVGGRLPVGYRFLADEFVAGGLTLAETVPFARALVGEGVAWLSVMAGCYDSFNAPNVLAEDRKEGFMAPFAAAVRASVPGVPVIAAGRIQRPELAEQLLREGAADLVGLGRVLFCDPAWPRKARGEVTEPITPCTPTCSLCMKRIIAQEPAYCGCWPAERRERFLERLRARTA